MRETPFQAVRREDLDPVCPYCNEQITEVYYKAKGPALLFPRTAVYFCPHCRKVLGLAQSRMA